MQSAASPDGREEGWSRGGRWAKTRDDRVIGRGVRRAEVHRAWVFAEK